MVNLIHTIDLDQQKADFPITHLEQGVYRLFKNDKEVFIEVLEVDVPAKSIRIRHKHHVHDILFKNDLDIVLDQMGIKRVTETVNTDIKAPMPGKVLDVVVKEGDEVKKGDAILILEAMKMENVLKAENDCCIKKINVASSENVEKNQILVELI
ncbi:MAG: acetyl-CoA carboxylase biotin carboxyl carrier protein subunit [Crocinitomicaceae bacterium]